MELKLKKSQTPKTIPKLKRERLTSRNKVIIDHETLLNKEGFKEKNKGVTRNKTIVNSILVGYCRELKKRLLSGRSYSISNDQTNSTKRKVITLVVKQVKKDELYFKRTSGFKKVAKYVNIDVDELLFKPTLKLELETRNGTLNKRPIRIKSSPHFKKSLQNIPVQERYKFPKA